MATKIVKASDPDIIKLGANYRGYYFNPVTNKTYSDMVPCYGPERLYELKPSPTGKYRFRDRTMATYEIHAIVKMQSPSEYNKIMASVPNLTSELKAANSPIQIERWVKVTDWRTLKVGDIIKTDDPDFGQFKSCTVSYLEPFEFTGSLPIRVNERGERATQWVSLKFPLYKLEPQQFSPQPQTSKGWVIMHQNEYGLTPIDWQGQASFAKIYKSESEADAKLKQLCDESPNTTFVKLEIKNFAITKTNPEFQLT